MESGFARAERTLIALLVFLVVLAIFPLTPGPCSDIKILIYELFTFPALALFFFRPRKSLNPFLSPTVLSFLVAVFVALNLAASLSSLNMSYSLLREFTKIASFFILFIVASDAYDTAEQVWNLTFAFCIAVSIASIYGLIQFMGLDPFPWDDKSGMLSQAPATFGNPNFASHSLVPALVLATGLFFQQKRRGVIVCIILFLCQFALTKTRGALVALAAAAILVMVALVISRKIKNPAYAVPLTLSVVFIVAVMGVIGVTTVTALTRGQPYPYGTGSAVALRYHSFYGASRLVQEKPLLGHGLGMYQVVNPKEWTPFEKKYFKEMNSMNDHVHNELLEIAVDAGLPAAIVYMAILLLGMYYGLSIWFSPHSFPLRSLGLTLAAFYCSFFVDGFFGFNFHVPVSTLLLFLMTGATAGILRKQQSHCPQVAFQRRWPRILCLCLLLIPGATIPFLGIRDFSAQFLHQRGRGALDYKYYAAAAELFEKAATLAPFDWNHSHWLGVTNMRMGQPDKAASNFKQTLSLNPYHYYAQAMLAEALLSVAASSSDEAPLIEAINSARTAIQLNPLLPEPHELLGEACLLRAKRLKESGKTKDSFISSCQEAENHLREAVQLGSKRTYKDYQFIARLRLEMEDIMGAEKALVESLEDRPDEIETWQLLLKVSQEGKDYDCILASLDRHIALLASSPTSALLVGTLDLMRAQVLFQGYGDESDAEEAFLYVAEKHPERVDVWAEFYAFAESTGREQLFNDALVQLADRQENEKLYLSPIVQAAALGLKGEENIAIEVTRLVEVLQEKQEEGMDSARIAKDFSWAADVLAKQAKRVQLLEEDTGDVFFKLGLAYGGWNDFRTAAELLNRALPHLSTQQRVLCLNRKATALTMVGETQEAVKTLEEAQAIDPHNFDTKYALAHALAQDGQHARARAEYLTLLNRFQLTEDGRRLIQQKINELSQRERELGGD